LGNLEGKKVRVGQAQKKGFQGGKLNEGVKYHIVTKP